MGQTGHTRLLGHALALFVTIVWGTTLISSKILLRAFAPLEIMTFRFLIAWAVLFVISPKPLLPRSLKSELPYIGAGITGLTLYFLLENSALEYTLASNVGIIISAAPMFTALFMWLSRRAKRPGWAFFVGFIIAMAGITLISLANGESLELNPLGDLLTVGAALCWGAYGVFIELTQKDGLNQIQVTRKVFFWGLICVIPLAPIVHLDLSPARLADPVMLFNICYLGLVASALGFVCWNRAVVLLGAVSACVYIYLTPVVTLIASFLILGEPIRPQAIGAIALILLGLWLSQRSGPPSAAEP